MNWDQEIKVEQLSPDWLMARVGSLGASRVHDAVAKTRNGWAASRAKLVADLVCERLTGNPSANFVSPAMDWGIEKEAEAKRAYAFIADCDVKSVGMFRHHRLNWTHASPDGVIAEDGLVEIKCPTTPTHLAYLLGTPVDEKYVKQMQWQMACTGASWCDFVSFDPRFPVDFAIKHQRVERDDKAIAELEEQIEEFLSEVDEKIKQLQSTTGGDINAEG